MTGPGCTKYVGITREGVQDQYRVRAVVRTPRLVRQAHVRHHGAGLQGEVAEVGELPVAHGIPLPPRTGDESGIHAGC